MPLYDVAIWREAVIIMSERLEIDAPSPEQAQQLALRLYEQGHVELYHEEMAWATDPQTNAREVTPSEP